MPTPRESYMNTVEAAPVSGQRVATADYGAAGEIIGRAAQGFGQDVQRGAQDLDQIRTMQAVSDTKKADTAYMLGAAAITSGYQQLEKGDATAARTKALADLDALGTAQRAELKDNRARQMFDEHFQQRKADATLTIDGHFHKEVLAESDETSIGRQSASLTVAADSYANPAVMNANIETAVQEETGRMRGSSPEAKAAAAAVVRSAGLFGAWTQIQDPLQKEQFRVANSDRILPKEEAAMLKANEAGLFDARGDINEANFFNNLSTGAPPAMVAAGAPKFVPANPVDGRGYSPVRGAVRGDDAAAHARRGSMNKGVDFVAPAGSAIRPPMSGTVVETGFNADNGNYIKVKYDNGLTGIFLHMKTPAAVEQGGKVDPGTILGVVGSTGHSTGPHVHYSVRDAAGNYVDPDTVSYKGGGAAGTAPRHKAQDVDTAAIYDQAYAYAEAHNLSPRETEDLLKRIDVRANRDRALQQDQDRVNGRAAMEVVANLGESLTKRSQIPNYAALTPSDRIQIDNIIERNTAPVEPKADGQAVTDMRLAEIENPDVFLQKNPFAMSMTRAEQADIAVRQAKMRKEREGGDAALHNDSRIKESADRYLFRVPGITKDVDTNAEKELRIAYYDYVRRQVAVAVAKNGGKDITPSEYENIASEAAITVTVGDKKVPLFSMANKPDTIHMSKIDAAKIGWHRANPGQPMPSDAWFEQQMQGR